MISEKLPDEKLIRLFKAGATREAAFAAIIRKYQERLYWHLRRMLHVHEDADDVLQNTFIKVWKNLDKFREDARLYTWLYRIATNEALTHINKEKKHRNGSLDNEDLGLADRLRADEYFDGDEAAIKLQEAIDQLPEKQKLVFNMRYFQELKYDELSEILETSVGALKASYHHAVKKIEQYLKSS